MCKRSKKAVIFLQFNQIKLIIVIVSVKIRKSATLCKLQQKPK